MSPPPDLDSLQHVSHQVLYLLDRELRILALTPSARDHGRSMWGREPRVGDSMVDLSGSSLEDAFPRRMAEAFRGERIRDTRRFGESTGGGRVLEITYDPVPGSDGGVEAVLFGAVDVTELHELRERQGLLDRALANTSEGVLIADARAEDLPIVYANDAVLRMTGYPQQAFLGRNCRFLQGERTDQPGVARMRAAVRAGEPVRARVQNQRADGGWFWNEVSLTPIRDPHGRLTHYLGIQRDVTNEVVLAEKAERAERLLATEARAAAIVHDLNNLLTILDLGLDELLAAADADLQRRIGDLRDVLASGALIARRALTDGADEPAACNIADLVRQRARVLRRLVRGATRLDLQVQADGPVIVPCRASGLDQVLANLVANAGDAVGEGGHVRVVLEAQSTSVCLRVIDDGPGVPTDHQARLFEPLFSTKGASGTGLGLATVRRIVEQAGGEVTLESAPGHTCFTVTLPRVPALETRTWSPTRILYVEDEPLLARLVLRHLRRQGHDVVHARRLDEALAALARSEPAVLITDADLPDGSGLDLIAAGRRQVPGLPVVLATGEVMAVTPPNVVLVAKPFGLMGIDAAIDRARALSGAAAVRPDAD